MIPVVSPAEMGAIDAAAPEPVEVLIGRAGDAVARAATRLMGGTYGRHVVVVAGKGNNGNDGRAAAAWLRRRGVRITVVDAADAPSVLPPADLVIDAAYGTGFRGTWRAPDPGGVPVLAVDIPSGVDGLTGEVAERVLAATRTVTFAALKPGLLLPPGSGSAGRVSVADIGLDVSSARAHLVQGVDVAGWLPARPAQAHKWRAALYVVAGSPGMTGAAHLAASSAQRGGAGMVRLGSPGVDHDPLAPTEAVGRPLPAVGWDAAVLEELPRCHALVVGPGLGRAPATASAVCRAVAAAPVPVLVDGDGLVALAGAPGGSAGVLRGRGAATVLTPHDGEFARLAGGPPAADRIGAARELAARLGAVVLLKGACSVVAEPGGAVLVSASGDARLATAGTGDVLSGLVGALLAQGVPAFEAAAAGAYVHGVAGTLGSRVGLVASDLVTRLPTVLSDPGVWP
ncbi:MAG: NAD(P)H-hydrate dehydratase [Acidimicrobiales bacterium]|nr:NAD(P)H-hydrate dehydratase [Acidimicrobiales bacterium]